jgi:hypothetical protein
MAPRERRLRSGLGWIASAALAVGLYLGLDPYRRLGLEYGYGPERRAFFAETLRCARLLQEGKEISFSAHDHWHLVGEWSRPEEGPPRTSQRRARIVLPVLEPVSIEVEIAAVPLLGPVEVELGVNGAALTHAQITEGGAPLRFEVEGSMLFRGDNTIYVYRRSRISSPDPWIALRGVTFRTKLPARR